MISFLLNSFPSKFDYFVKQAVSNELKNKSKTLGQVLADFMTESQLLGKKKSNAKVKQINMITREESSSRAGKWCLRCKTNTHNTKMTRLFIASGNQGSINNLGSTTLFSVN